MEAPPGDRRSTFRFLRYRRGGNTPPRCRRGRCQPPPARRPRRKDRRSTEDLARSASGSRPSRPGPALRQEFRETPAWRWGTSHGHAVPATRPTSSTASSGAMARSLLSGREATPSSSTPSSRHAARGWREGGRPRCVPPASPGGSTSCAEQPAARAADDPRGLQRRQLAGRGRQPIRRAGVRGRRSSAQAMEANANTPATRKTESPPRIGRRRWSSCGLLSHDLRGNEPRPVWRLGLRGGIGHGARVAFLRSEVVSWYGRWDSSPHQGPRRLGLSRLDGEPRHDLLGTFRLLGTSYE